ncbi:MAG: VWA domain-containing protein [Chloroflexi bacterium]|nr:VWA domain-containing protein [Chloroflexota bacterium]
MKKMHLPFLLVLVVMILFLPSSAGAGPAKKVTVVLLLDNSGSMNVSDPQDLRFTGARLFSTLLDKSDALGLVVFSTQAEALTEHLMILNAQSDRQNLLASLDSIPSPQGYTDIKAALEQARRLLPQFVEPEEKVVLVLLTDGQPEIPVPYPQYEQEALDLAKSLHVPVMAIALTSSAQTPFLDRMTQVTGGQVYPARDASDLMRIYLQVLGEIKDRTVIGGREFQAETSLNIDPALAPYLYSATFVITGESSAQVQPVGPQADILSSSVFEDGDPRFIVRTLENPLGGRYTFRLAGGGKHQVWVILYSKLRAKIVQPGSFFPEGQDLPIMVNMLEETPTGQFIKIIGQAEFTALITRPDGSQESLDRFYDDGTHGDRVAGDGDYTRVYPNTGLQGEYQIEVQGWKGAIPVQAEGQVEIIPFPEIQVIAPVPDSKIRSDVVKFVVHLSTDPPDSLDQGYLVAHLTNPLGQEEEIVLKPDKTGYVGTYKPAVGGKIRAHIETHQARYRGVEFQTALDYEFDLELIHFADVQVEKMQTLTGCLKEGRAVDVSLTLKADTAESLHLSASTGWEVFPSQIQASPGSQLVTVQLRSIQPGENDQDELVTLYVNGDNTLMIRPAAEIQVVVQNPGLLVRCQIPIRWGSGVLLVLLAGTIGFRRIQAARRPVRISGTLRYGPRLDDHAHLVEVDLTALQKHRISIGSSETCAVRIVAGRLDPEHARLVMEEQADRHVVILEPLGQVQKGYGWQTTRFALGHAQIFRMGTLEFQYLSDSGE